MPPPLDHNQVMQKLCGTCVRKGKTRNISARILELIRTYHYPEYSTTSGDLPTRICNSCDTILRVIDKAHNANKKPNKKLPEIDYRSFRGTRVTRTSSSCPCKFCEVWRLNGHEQLIYENQSRDKAGRPGPAGDAEVPAKESILICPKCQSQIGQKAGVAHKCNATSLQENCVDMIMNIEDTKKQEMIVSQLNRTIANRNSVSTKSGTLELASKGRFNMKITFGNQRPVRKFSIEDIMKIRTSIGISGLKTKTLCTAIRVCQGRNSIEAGVREAITEQNHFLEVSVDSRYLSPG